jgi:hypothetical protein
MVTKWAPTTRTLSMLRIRQNVAQQKANRSLPGFPATPFWEVFKLSDAPVIESSSGFHFMHLLSKQKKIEMLVWCLLPHPS